MAEDVPERAEVGGLTRTTCRACKMHGPGLICGGRDMAMLRAYPVHEGAPMKAGYVLVLALALLFCTAAFASEAPWYKWMNLADRTIMCAQTSPGDTWVRYQGPYADSRCSRPGNPR